MGIAGERALAADSAHSLKKKSGLRTRFVETTSNAEWHDAPSQKPWQSIISLPNSTPCPWATFVWLDFPGRLRMWCLIHIPRPIRSPMGRAFLSLIPIQRRSTPTQSPFQ